MTKINGRKVLITAGPTYEAIDPVRFIGNRSSGKQGYAIANALAQHGAEVTLISGPSALPAPENVNVIRVETALEMLEACENALPADIGIFTAAVSDWRPKTSQSHKIKKRDDNTPPTIELIENPDILKTISHAKNRPSLVIGFAAETEKLLENAKSKRARKGCDCILANDVSGGKTFGTDQNHVWCITSEDQSDWGAMTKCEVAQNLVQWINSNL